MKYVLPTLTLLMLLASTSWGMNIQLQWNAVNSAAVAGYRVYYSSTSPDTPLQGSGAAEGPSPVDVGNTTTALLTGLPSGAHYIAVTAYAADGLESPLSSIVCNYWMPNRSYPADGATNVPRDVQFAWSQPSNPGAYQFMVYYGRAGGPMTLQQAALPLNQGPSALPPASGSALALVLVAGLFLMSVARSARLRWMTASLLGAALLASCGSAGDSTVLNNAIDGSGGSAAALLEPNTTYEWKVVADNGTVLVESTTGSFTTGSN